MTKQTSGKPFFDANVLIYAFQGDSARSETAQKLLAEGGRTGVQALNEFVSVARRKLGMTWEEIRNALRAIRTLCPLPVNITLEMHEAAVLIAERQGYSIFDSLIISAALEAGCSTLLSEDMQHGQVVDGLTIHNPFRNVAA